MPNFDKPKFSKQTQSHKKLSSDEFDGVNNNLPGFFRFRNGGL